MADINKPASAVIPSKLRAELEAKFVKLLKEKVEALRVEAGFKPQPKVTEEMFNTIVTNKELMDKLFNMVMTVYKEINPRQYTSAQQHLTTEALRYEHVGTVLRDGFLIYIPADTDLSRYL